MDMKTSIQKIENRLWSPFPYTVRAEALALAITIFWLKLQGLPSSGFEYNKANDTGSLAHSSYKWLLR